MTQLTKGTIGHPTSVWGEVRLDDKKRAWATPFKPRTEREGPLDFWILFFIPQDMNHTGPRPQQGKSLCCKHEKLEAVLSPWLHKNICLNKSLQFQSRPCTPFRGSSEGVHHVHRSEELTRSQTTVWGRVYNTIHMEIPVHDTDQLQFPVSTYTSEAEDFQGSHFWIII